MLYELSHTRGGLFPEIAQLLQLMEVLGASSAHKASNGIFPKINTGITPDSVEIHATVAGSESPF